MVWALVLSSRHEEAQDGKEGEEESFYLHFFLAHGMWHPDQGKLVPSESLWEGWGGLPIMTGTNGLL